MNSHSNFNPQWNSNRLKTSEYQMLWHFFHKGLLLYSGSFIKAKDAMWPNQREWEKLTGESIKWQRFARPVFVVILRRMFNSHWGKHTVRQPWGQALISSKYHLWVCVWAQCSWISEREWVEITLLTLSLSFKGILETSTDTGDLSKWHYCTCENFRNDYLSLFVI